jgi:putative ABC transport system permease protein
MRTLFQDIRCRLRMLLQSSVVTVVAVVVAVLGIGADSSIFNDVYSIRRHPRQFRVAPSLAMIWRTGRITTPGVVSPANHSNWKSRNRVFGDITAAVDLARVNLTGAGAPEELLAGEVTANFFQMIGVEPVLGRSFSPQEDKRGHDRVAILSHGLWRRRFGSDTGVIGRSIVLNGESHQVIGILPRDFSWNNRRTDVWVPYLLDPNRDERMAGARYTRVADRTGEI